MYSLVVWEITDPLYLPLKRGGPVCLPLEKERCIIEEEKCIIEEEKCIIEEERCENEEERCENIGGEM